MKLNGLKYIPLLASSMFAQVGNDPADLAFKVLERLRQIGLFDSHSFDGAITSKGLIDKARLQGNSSTGFTRLIWKREKSRFKVDFPIRQQTRDNLGRWKLSAVHFLTNSFPYSVAGYAERSHKNLRSQVFSGISVKALTRFAYPVDVGVLPSNVKDTIEGVQYYRILPPVYFPLRTIRDAFTVRMLESKARDAHILHATTGFHNAHIVARTAAKLEIPWIYEVRGEPESTWASKFDGFEREQAEKSEFVSLSKAKETQAAQAADHVVVLSEISKDEFIARGIPPEKISVIPNGVDEEFLDRDFNRSDLRRELGLPLNGKLVGTVSSIVPYEGLDYLIQAMKFLPEYTALVVGDGVSLPSLRELAKQLGVESQVIFVGRQPSDQIWKWYAVLDTFVMPRLDADVCRRVTPLKSLPAQALGIPVVASDLPALREVTGEFALFAKPEDAKDLAKKIKSVDLHNMSSEALEWVANRTWESNGARYLSLYRKILNSSVAR